MKINTNPYSFFTDMWENRNTVVIGVEKDPTPNINIPYQLDFYNFNETYPTFSLHFNSKNSFSFFCIDDVALTKDMNNNPFYYKRLKGCGFTADLNKESIFVTVNANEVGPDIKVHVFDKKVLEKAFQDQDMIRQFSLYNLMHMVDEADVIVEKHEAIRKDLENTPKHSYIYRLIMPTAPLSMQSTLDQQLKKVKDAYTRPKCPEYVE
nr:MAG TPA: hypothetical protein [Caudoviricetes sp.]